MSAPPPRPPNTPPPRRCGARARGRPPTTRRPACATRPKPSGEYARPVDRHTKIVATIGPASRDPKTLERMVAAGLDVARLNFSHGPAEPPAEPAQRVRSASGRVGRPVAILQDLPGPKLRIGALIDDHVDLK